MATAQTALQALILALQTVAATTPAGDSEAKRSVLLASAIEKLASTTTLEAEILATIQAIVDSFETQGAAQVATLDATSADLVAAVAAAQAALEVASAQLVTDSALLTGVDGRVTSIKGTVEANTASLAGLTARRPLAEAMSVGIPTVLLSAVSNQLLTNQYYTHSLMIPVYDKRPAGGKLFNASNSQSQSAYNSSTQLMIRSHAAGVTTVHRQASASNRSNAQMEYFLPLAKSATDATTKLSVARFYTAQMDGNGYVHYWNTGSVCNEDAWGTDFGISAANSPRIAWMAYDRVNKTLVYMNYNNTANLSSGEPPANQPTIELFANGTTRVVTAVTGGWQGWLAYVLGNPTRFTVLTMPTTPVVNSTVWGGGSWSSSTQPRLRMGGTLEQYAGFSIGVSGSESGFNPYMNMHIDGSYGWYTSSNRESGRGHMLSAGEPGVYSIFQDSSAMLKLDYAKGGNRTPMWVIEADGSVNLYSIYYQPDFSGLFIYHASYPEHYTPWDGTRFMVVDHNNVVLAQGYAPLDPEMKRFGPYDQGGQFTAQVFPSGFHIADNVIQTFVAHGMKRLPFSATSFPTWGSYCFLTHQKLLGA